MELRLPGVNSPLLCGRVGGVKSCHGDMGAALRENIGLPRRHGTWGRGTKPCHGVEGAALRAWCWGVGRKMGFWAINCDIFADL